MKESTEDWVRKAEVDFESARILWHSSSSGVYDAVCYHCQQCVEKYVKARMNEVGVEIIKTHHLDALLSPLTRVEPHWSAIRGSLLTLGGYATDFRYPGPAIYADTQMAQEALHRCEEIRRVIRRSLDCED